MEELYFSLKSSRKGKFCFGDTVYHETTVVAFRGIRAYKYNHKGARQKLLSGFFPLRVGVHPDSAKGFWSEWISVKEGRGLKPNSAEEKIC